MFFLDFGVLWNMILNMLNQVKSLTPPLPFLGMSIIHCFLMFPFRWAFLFVCQALCSNLDVTLNSDSLLHFRPLF